MTSGGGTPGPAPLHASVVDSMAVGYVALDFDWVMTAVNATGERILGRSAGDLVGLNMWDEFPGARELEFGRVYEAVMRSRQASSLEAYYPGLSAWFELRVEPTPDGIALYFLDVTARRRAEAAAARAVEHLRVVSAASAALSDSLDITENIGRLARLVVPALGQWAIVSLVEDDGGLSGAGSWHVDEALRPLVARYADLRIEAFSEASVSAEIIRTGQPLLVDDAAKDVLARMPAGEARDLFAELAPRACGFVPIVARGRAVGLLGVFGDTPWSREDYELVAEIAARAALAIENSRAFAREELARRQAEQSERRLALLAEVSETLAAAEHPDMAVGRLARLVVPELADWCMITAFDEDGTPRDIGWAHRDPQREGDVAAYAARHSSVMNDHSAVTTAYRTGAAVILEQFPDERIYSALPDTRVQEMARGLDPFGVAALPLAVGARTFGVLTLVTTSERGRHTDAELATAREVARRAGPVLESAWSAQRARTLAETMQRSLLDTAKPGPELEVATLYRPALLDRQVGGDWYDCFALPDGTTVVSIGDAMGHDLAAISAMAQLRTFMRAAGWTVRQSPADVLAATDSASLSLGPGTFATALVAQFDSAGALGVSVVASNAGHPPPVVVHSDGRSELLTQVLPDPPLGVSAGLVRQNHEVVLEPGAVMLLFTDGLFERHDRDVESGLAAVVEAARGGHVRDLDQFIDDLVATMGGVDSHADDVAVLAVRVRGGAQDTLEPSQDTFTTRELVVTLPSGTSPGRTGPVAADARHWCRELLTGIGPGAPVDECELVVSELITNAVRAGATEVRLVVTIGPDHVRLAVRDDAPGIPQMVVPDDFAGHGRGLLIVDRLSRSWDVALEPDGKVVWSEILFSS